MILAAGLQEALIFLREKKNILSNIIFLPSNCIILHKHLGGRASPHGTKHEMGDKAGLYAEFQ